MKELQYKYNIGYEYNINDSKFKIMDRKIDMLQTGKRIKKYLVQCLKCGDQMWKDEKYIYQSINGAKVLSGKGCKHCNQRNKATKSNCIANTAPYIIEWLKDKEDAFRYSRGSGQKTWFVCPYCGEEKYISIKQVCRDKRICCNKCGDGITYPNKFGYALLKQLKVNDLVPEYSDTWTQGCRYDFCFTKDGNPYLLEMDGWFHFEDGFGGTTLKKNKNKDQLKEKLASDNGYQLIRINCIKSDFEFIKSNVQLSVLSSMYDLSKVDWVQVEKECISNKIIEICNYYKSNPNETMVSIGEKYGVHQTTVTKYLETGSRCGIINFKNTLDKYRDNYNSVVDMINNGFSIKEIMNITNLKDYNVYAIRKKATLNGDIIQKFQLDGYTNKNESIKVDSEEVMINV